MISETEKISSIIEWTAKRGVYDGCKVIQHLTLGGVGGAVVVETMDR